MSEGRRLRVLMSRHEIAPERLPGATAVVLDVLLATTTLVTILENGARRVFPVATLEEAEALCEKLDDGTLLRGGEQDALAIEGYDHGPYPEEYPPEVVSGKDVVFVTTNGTRAIAQAAPAGELLIASLRNAPAVAEYLQAKGPDSVYIICAGSRGRFVLDDFAGAAVLLSCLDTGGWRLNDAATLALELGGRCTGRVLEVLKASRSGRWFVENGRLPTLEFAAEVGASGTLARVRDGQLTEIRKEG
jgi:2-phosphosulfolactate phosphatase